MSLEWQVKELEPNVDVHAALYSPNTGITDFAQITRAVAKEIEACGRGLIQTNFNVESVERSVEGLVEVKGKELRQKGPHRRGRETLHF